MAFVYQQSTWKAVLLLLSWKSHPWWNFRQLYLYSSECFSGFRDKNALLNWKITIHVRDAVRSKKKTYPSSEHVQVSKPWQQNYPITSLHGTGEKASSWAWASQPGIHVPPGYIWLFQRVHLRLALERKNIFIYLFPNIQKYKSYNKNSLGGFFFTLPFCRMWRRSASRAYSVQSGNTLGAHAYPSKCWSGTCSERLEPLLRANCLNTGIQ